MRCDACGRHTPILEGRYCLTCADEQVEVARERDAMLINVVTSWATCDVCLTPIDAPGFCGRCQYEFVERDLRSWAS